jgi:hypothetical protein
MKRPAFLLLGVTLLASTLGLAIACGGRVGSAESSSGTTEPVPASTSEPSPSTTQTTFPSLPPLPPKEPTPTGTLVSNPGLVTCGTDDCTIGKQECCPFEKPPACLTTCGHHQRLCDETADCPKGQQCCGFAGSSGGAMAACSDKECTSLSYAGPDSSKPAEQLCKVDAECKKDMQCVRTVDDQGITFGRCLKKS